MLNNYFSFKIQKTVVGKIPEIGFPVKLPLKYLACIDVIQLKK